MPKRTPTLAWQNGDWIPTSELKIPLDDVGFRQGVVAVERLRTYGGKPAALAEHIIRWRRTLEELYLPTVVDLDQIRPRIDELLSLNQSWIDEVGDCGIVMLATPGSPPAVSNEIMHLHRIDHSTITRRQIVGQPLFITDVHQPSGKCWPRDIKVRTRLHYYLADQQAHQHDVEAAGLLLDSDGTVTETSIANIAIVKNNRVTFPPSDQVLPGVTQQAVQELCDDEGVNLHWEALWPAEIRDADEVWLMGTDGGWWFANKVDGAKINGAEPGPVYRKHQPMFVRRMNGTAIVKNL